MTQGETSSYKAVPGIESRYRGSGTSELGLAGWHESRDAPTLVQDINFDRIGARKGELVSAAAG